MEIFFVLGDKQRAASCRFIHTHVIGVRPRDFPMPIDDDLGPLHQRIHFIAPSCPAVFLLERAGLGNRIEAIAVEFRARNLSSYLLQNHAAIVPLPT